MIRYYQLRNGFISTRQSVTHALLFLQVYSCQSYIFSSSIWVKSLKKCWTFVQSPSSAVLLHCQIFSRWLLLAFKSELTHYLCEQNYVLV